MDSVVSDLDFSNITETNAAVGRYCDFNDDGFAKINTLEAMLIQQYALKKINTLCG